MNRDSTATVDINKTGRQRTSSSCLDEDNIMERFGTTKQTFVDEDHDYESDYDMLEDTVQSRRQAQVVKNKFDFPEPIYPNVINIGNVSGRTRLDQILEQLLIKEENYLYWTSNDKVKVIIPPELYKSRIQ